MSGKQFSIAEENDYPIDLQDQLLIHVDSDVISQFLPTTNNSSTQLSSIQDRLKQLKSALSSIDDLSKAAAAIADERTRLITLNQPAGPEYQNLVADYEIPWHNTKQSILAYLKATLKDPTKAPAQLNELVKDPTNTTLAAFLKAEISKTSKAVTDALNNATSNAPFQVQMRAYVSHASSAGSPVHLDGYDNGKPGDFQFRDKLSFVQTPDQQKQVDDSLKLAQSIKDTIDSVRANHQTVVAAVRQVYLQLLGISSELPDPDQVRVQIAKLSSDLNKLKDKNYLITASSGPAIVDIASRVSLPEIPKDFLDMATKVKELQRPTSDGDLFGNVQDIIQIMPKLPTDVMTWLGQVQASTSALTDIHNALTQSIKDLALKQNPEAVSDAESLLQSVDDTNHALTKMVDLALWLTINDANALAKLTASGNVTGGVSDATWTAYTLPLTAVRDTTIDMNTVPAAAGDMLVIDATVLQHDAASGNDEPVSNTTARLPIASLGFSSNVSGDLLFIERQGNNTFVTATAISYIYKWKPWTKTDGWHRFLSVLNPGCGLSVAALNFPGNTLQTGVGITGTLINGFISVGYGRNLQESSRSGYFFFGMRFIGKSFDFTAKN